VQTAKQTGDLLVTVIVHVPDAPSAAERDLITKLAEVSTPAPRSDLGV
jgi:DnaJ-class molecular chaperone